MKNCIVGQSGGPTAAINASLLGVYEGAKAAGASHVYGMRFGIEGLLSDRVTDLDAILGAAAPDGAHHRALLICAAVLCVLIVPVRRMLENTRSKTAQEPAANA